jgi:hypothetical protein
MSTPIIITPENITVQSTGSNAGTSSGNVTLISDGVNSDLTIVCNYDYSDSSFQTNITGHVGKSGDNFTLGFFPNGINTINCSSTNNDGTSEKSFTVTVSD